MQIARDGKEGFDVTDLDMHRPASTLSRCCVGANSRPMHH
jgi:hypothetical protein